MVTKNVVIQNKTGLHARPASDLVRLCRTFDCDIKLLAKENTYDAKAIINILTAGLVKGTEVTVLADGDQEQTALDEVVSFISNLTE